MSDESKESAFVERWRREQPLYAAWGLFVSTKLCELIRERVAPISLEVFLRIPVTSRVKELDSLIQKAFHRNKPYTDPFADIEDKVGLRFVVLLSEDIRTVETAIIGAIHWTATKARDFADEREAKPYEFDYQSLHYVVRSRIPISFGSVEVPQNIPCEIQVKTLLQHAYSELTHDTIYKPSVTATPALKRAAAKSMALIEATDDYFSQVNYVINQALKNAKELILFLASRYTELVGEPPHDTPLNSLIVDHYKSIATNFDKEFDVWINEKSYIADIVKERAPRLALYRVPSIFLVYYCVSVSPRLARIDSPLRDAELEPIYSDLGLALHG
jgi:putative GTP pyrophosphokinase